jgi:8-oxo-dGTP diphosphatase
MSPNTLEDTFHLGIKALFRDDAGQVLLMQVNPAELSGHNLAYWDLPGGRIQSGETPQEALRREVQEEMGVSSFEIGTHLGMFLSNIRIPIKEHGTVGLILSVYECQLGTDTSPELSSEHLSYKWVKPSEASEMLKMKFSLEFCKLVDAL